MDNEGIYSNTHRKTWFCRLTYCGKYEYSFGYLTTWVFTIRWTRVCVLNFVGISEIADDSLWPMYASSAGLCHWLTLWQSYDGPSANIFQNMNHVHTSWKGIYNNSICTTKLLLWWADSYTSIGASHWPSHQSNVLLTNWQRVEL